MLKLSKLSDYAVVLMQALPDMQSQPQSALQVAERTQLPAATARKLLKSLQAARLVQSTQGPQGGYQLARSPAQIRLSDMLAAIDGRLSVADCQHFMSDCQAKHQCAMRSHWQRLNGLFVMILQQISLQDLRQDADQVVCSQETKKWQLSHNFLQELVQMGYVETPQ